MTKFLLVLCMTTVVTAAGLLVWRAEATPLTGADSLTAIRGHQAVQKVGCMFGTHRCASRHQMVMHLFSGTSRNRKEMHLPALLVARQRARSTLRLLEH